MSKEGQLARGEQYYNMRNRNGVYPDGITGNPYKMADLNLFLETLETVEEEKPKKKKAKGD